MDPITATIVVGMCNAIGSYLLSKGGDIALERVMSKSKVRKIIKKDRKYIQKKFAGTKYTEYPIEAFLLEEVFQNPDFLYTFSSFPQNKRDGLFDEFCNYALSKGMEIQSIDKDNDFRRMLEDCVNYNNQLVHNTILSPSQRLMEKDLRENMSTIMGYAGHTLDSAAETLEENPILEYTHRQIDGILRTLRMDLRFYRFVLLICTIGLMIMPLIVFAIYAKYHFDSESMILVSIIICVATFPVLLFGGICCNKAIHCERSIQIYTNELWKDNFSLYSHVLGKTMLEKEERLHYLQAKLDIREDQLDEREKQLYEREDKLNKERTMR